MNDQYYDSHDLQVDHITTRTLPAYEALLRWLLAGRILVNGMPLEDAHDLALFPNELDDHLAKVLGYLDALDMIARWDAPSAGKVLDMLSGPHGYAVYKAIMARRGM